MTVDPAFQKTLQESLKTAYEAHGHNVFEEAYMSFLFEIHVRRNRELWKRVILSHDPGDTLVKWHLSGELDDASSVH